MGFNTFRSYYLDTSTGWLQFAYHTPIPISLRLGSIQEVVGDTISHSKYWLRGLDLNQRSSGYEPDDVMNTCLSYQQVSPELLESIHSQYLLVPHSTLPSCLKMLNTQKIYLTGTYFLAASPDHQTKTKPLLMPYKLRFELSFLVAQNHLKLHRYILQFLRASMSKLG